MALRELIQRQPDAKTLRLWFAQVPYAAYLGIEAEIMDDEILFLLPGNPDLIGNPALPAVHGGVVGAFMEQAASMHLLSKMVKPVLPKIVNFCLDYLRPTGLKDTYASCELGRQGRQIANIGVSAWQERRDQPCALARAHFMLTDPE